MDRKTAGQSAREFLEQTSFLYGGNATYMENLQARYERDPASVDWAWRRFFDDLGDDDVSIRKSAAGASWKRAGWPLPVNGELTSALDGNWRAVETAVGEKPERKIEAPNIAASEADVHRATRDSVRALMMIRAYRMRGHLHADLDPLGLEPLKDHEELHPSSYGFTDDDLDRQIFIDGVLGLEFSTLREILAILRRTYCSTIGYEFMHISDPEQKAWIQERIEGADKGVTFSGNAKRAILERLVEVKGYERYLDRKFTGTKRFGLDGAEATIPALEEILARGAALGVTDVVLGMAHRGRLNVLSQVMRKPHRAIFHEFKGGSFVPDEVEGSGDVKYHLGTSSDRSFDGRNVHLSLTANPSHLEISDPVVLGKTRAKQDQNGDTVERSGVLPLLIHGDAAFAGQGVVAECFGLSGLKGYRTGGSVHFIINNQIGFTTDPRYSRSSPYPSDLAKMIEAPIFHVNGDDPEAVVHVARMAIEFRQKFHKPVVIDMFCFRFYGHNEGDEPAFTQPRMYRKIRAHPSTLEIYGNRLIAEGVVAQDDIDKANAAWIAHLDREFEASQSYKPGRADWLEGRWTGLRTGKDDGDDARRGQTGVPVERLREIGEKITRVPDGFKVHPTVQRFLDGRRKIIEAGEGVDWATAESLALGSLADEGFPVRLTGQDSERGTFTQRHSVLSDQETGERYTPLANIRDGQARCEIINSMLSEEAVLGFEYGYTLAEPKALVLWEAQFGDFANGAQVVFDQFISSGERKWLRMSGLVCLLPHGYDGQGPEHSSARIERYLQSSAEDNWQVANCTTPANYFHVLRRQMKRDFRKPLILMTPKSLLRHKLCKSTLADLGEGTSFHRILRDDAETRDGGQTTLLADDTIRRVIMCSGKVYYDLYEEREKRGLGDIYLLRLEQLYPFPAKSLATELARFPNADAVWCQEESRNMGAWSFVEPYLEWALAQAGSPGKRARYVGRPASASPAVGVMSQHLSQLRSFLDQALGT
ncbi:MAG TPA: 2-oxoglutarate dehydrogenase E1 component [Devosiaceae bacterium]|jgi:2-oxoglutarate dehydrogenase E1 component